MRTKVPLVSPIFRSALQAQVLTLLFGSVGRGWRPVEIEQRIGASAASVHRELQRLVAAGLVEKRFEGRNAIYRLDTASPLVAPLGELVEKTVGVEPRLKEKLAELEGVDHASIFGSWVTGGLTADSDIDVLVVADRKVVDRVLDALVEVERVVGREVNACLYLTSEFERKRKQDGFLRRILSQPRSHLVGREL